MLIIINNFKNAEEYSEESAVEHVRRLLDIVACTTSFGPAPPPPPPPSPKDADGAKEPSSSSATTKAAASASSGGRRTASPPPASPSCAAAKESSAAKEAAAKESAAAAELDAEMSGACPRLGAFYEFFSLANLTPPLQCKWQPLVICNPKHAWVIGVKTSSTHDLLHLRKVLD